jgi:hypothetical protein
MLNAGGAGEMLDKRARVGATRLTLLPLSPRDGRPLGPLLPTIPGAAPAQQCGPTVLRLPPMRTLPPKHTHTHVHTHTHTQKVCPSPERPSCLGSTSRTTAASPACRPPTTRISLPGRGPGSVCSRGTSFSSRPTRWRARPSAPGAATRSWRGLSPSGTGSGVREGVARAWLRWVCWRAAGQVKGWQVQGSRAATALACLSCSCSQLPLAALSLAPPRQRAAAAATARKAQLQCLGTGHNLLPLERRALSPCRLLPPSCAHAHPS